MRFCSFPSLAFIHLTSHNSPQFLFGYLSPSIHLVKSSHYTHLTLPAERCGWLHLCLPITAINSDQVMPNNIIRPHIRIFVWPTWGDDSQYLQDKCFEVKPKPLIQFILTSMNFPLFTSPVLDHPASVWNASHPLPA